MFSSSILPALRALVAILRERDIPFCVVGAIVPDLLLETPLPLKTNDADVVIFVEDFEKFRRVAEELLKRGFVAKSTDGHRFAHETGGFIDILPYSEQLAPDGKLQLDRTRTLNMAGFEFAVTAAQSFEIEPGLTVPLVPLALYAILKLVAHTDRGYEKDLAGVEHVLRHYAPDDDRRWGLTLPGRDEIVEYDFGPAYLLGVDGRQYLTAQVEKTLRPLLENLSVGEEEDDETHRRPRRHELFSWYQRGLLGELRHV